MRSVAGWRAALRLAWRDVVRHRGRSALVIALIGLPVLLLGVVDIGYRTYQLDPVEKVDRAIGAADVGLQDVRISGVTQGPEGFLGPEGATGKPAPRLSTDRVAALLPPGSRIISWQVAADPLVFRTRTGLAEARLEGLAYDDPIAHGLVTQRSGRAPRNAHEVAISSALARSAGLGVGAQLHALPARTFTVVGIVVQSADPRRSSIWTVPAAVPAADEETFVGLDDPGSVSWLASTPQPVDWARVRLANQRGLSVVSREVMLHPSAAAVAALRATGATDGNGTEVAALTLVIGMALLEVVLLAGPAFAVGAKRRARELALVAANGGSSRDLRRVVLATGLLLGGLAGVLGAIGAIGVAAAGFPVFRSRVSQVPGHFDVHPGELALLAGLGLAAALLASVAPARAAAHTDVVAALAGRRGSTRTRRWVPLLGMALVAGGAVLTLGGYAVPGGPAIAILVGAAITEIGLILCTPALLGFAARAARWSPVPVRLALRDAGRNRTAATPAVAAVMAAVVGAVSVMIGVASAEDQARRQYVPGLPPSSAGVVLGQTGAIAPAGVAAALRATLPTAFLGVQYDNREICPRGQRHCTITSTTPATVGEQGFSDPVFAAPSLAGLLFGARAAQARAALTAGRVVVVDDAIAVHAGTTRMQVTTSRYGPDGQSRTLGRAHTLTLAAVRIPAAGGYPLSMVVPLQEAHRLGVDVVGDQVLAQLRHQPSAAQVQAANARLHQLMPDPGLEIESGYRSEYGALRNALVLAAVAIAVLAALIATGLAGVDARADLRTLAAVGAAPATRRMLALTRAAVIAGVGTVAGVAAGFLAPAAWVLGGQREHSSIHFVVPWGQVAAVLVAVPLIALLLAGVSTRSRSFPD